MTDKIIVQQIIDGNRQAFKRLVKDHERLVGHMVGRIVHNKEAHDEICSDVFMKVYAQLHPFRFQSKLSTWIATIAYRLSINYTRKLSHFVDDQKASEAYFSTQWCEAANPEEIMQNTERHALVRSMANDLPIAYKTVLTLFYLEEMSYAEIMEITGMPEGTVKSYLNRGKHLLSDALKKYYTLENQST
jgi:RNA polymerase sigma-70 factor (ECF subfamily)